MENSSKASSALPPDDLARGLTVARPDYDAKLPHFAIAGDTYTVLLSGQDTAGRFCLIDMHVPPGGGPPPHRHNFEETFTLLEGEIEFIFRGAQLGARAGETLNVPANAPHGFRNVSERPARMLCLCSPAGQEEFFAAIGMPVATRTAVPPPLDEAAQKAFISKLTSLAPSYGNEMLG